MLLSFAFYGCFPVKFTKTPEFDGKIIDIETQEPIPNAKIYFKLYEDNRVSSDEHGYFKLLKNEEWGTFILLGPFDPVPPYGILVIEAKKIRDS